MSNPPDNYRSDRRVTLPPIRDLFRDEFMRPHTPTQESPSSTPARLRMSEEERESRPLSSRPSSPPSRMYRSTLYQLSQLNARSISSQEHLAPSTSVYQDRYQTPESSSPISTLPSRTHVPQHFLPSHRPSNYSVLHPQPSMSQSPNPRQSRALNTPSHASSHNRTPDFVVDSRAREAIQTNLVQMPRLPAPPKLPSSSQVHGPDSPPALVRASAPWVVATNMDVGQIYEDDNRRRSIARPFEAGPTGHSSSHVVPLGRFLDEGSHPPLGKYDCKFCGKLFNRPSSLRIHLNSHTGEKPFVCPHPDCGRSFSVLSNMRRHARVHMSSPKEQELEESNDETSTQSSPTAPSTPGFATVVQEAAPMQTSARPQTPCRRDSNASASSSSSRRSRGTSSDYEQTSRVERPEKRSRYRPI